MSRGLNADITRSMSITDASPNISFYRCGHRRGMVGFEIRTDPHPVQPTPVRVDIKRKRKGVEKTKVGVTFSGRKGGR